jgi:hypothetical protein
MCHWTSEALTRLEKEFDVVHGTDGTDGNGFWGYIQPRAEYERVER